MSDDSGPDRRSSGDEQHPPGKSPSTGERSPWVLAGLGMQFFVALVLFAYAGAWLDRRFDSSPLWMLVGVFLGGGGTFYLSYRRLMGPGNGK
jgi:hypothetical protein